MSAERFIASKLAKGGERWSRTSNTIAWISVCLSVAIMIVAIAVVAGFKREIGSRVTGFMGSVLLIQPGQSPINEQYPFSEQLSYRESLLADPAVTDVAGVAWRSGLVKTDDNILGLYFKGVDSLYDFSFFSDCLVDGALPDYRGRISNDILLSRPVARKMGFRVGDDVVTYFIGDEVKVRKFRLCGLYEAGLEEIYEIFNLRHPDGYRGRSLSVSDIVELPDGLHFCDSFGWKPVKWRDDARKEAR